MSEIVTLIGFQHWHRPQKCVFGERCAAADAVLIPVCVLHQWFLANLSYQEALSDTQVAIVNILSSTSGQSARGPSNPSTAKEEELAEHIFNAMAKLQFPSCVSCNACEDMDMVDTREV